MSRAPPRRYVIAVLSGLFQRLRKAFKGWFAGTAIFASGLMLAYIVFVNLFGPLYSVRTMVALGVSGLADPFPLVSFLLRFYIIAYFAVPLGFIFMSLRRGADKGRFFTYAVAGIIGAACLLGVAGFADDSSVVLSLVGFTALLLVMLLEADRTPYAKTGGTKNFTKAFGIFYSVYMVFLFLLHSPSLEVTNFLDLHAFLLTLGSIQSISAPLALITAPIAIGISHKQKPDRMWFAFISAALLFVFMQVTQYYVESLVFAALVPLLFYAYGKERLLPPATPAAGVAGSGAPGLASPDRLTGILDGFVTAVDRFSGAVSSYLEVQTARSSDEVVDKLGQPLAKLAAEATLYRELTTGEVLKVRPEEFVPPLRRLVEVDGEYKSTGIKHYIICSRTGHGKTTLMKNLMEAHQDFAYLIVDRHSEYATIADGSEVLVLDTVFDPAELERIVTQVPRTELTSDRSILREAQVFSLEQQFNFAVSRLMTPEFLEDLAEKLFRGTTIILQPGHMSELVFTRLAHDLIATVFERKMQRQVPQGLVIVNEEAQNSFEITENGMERNKSHILIKLVMEGRKYQTALINISSDPEGVPKNVKDNSTLILGSIGTPALKRMVGEKLGMIYIRYIHELPLGYFFIDEVDFEGNYIVFPNDFTSVEGVKVLAT
jgi:hypothetical protein